MHNFKRILINYGVDLLGIYLWGLYRNWVFGGKLEILMKPKKKGSFGLVVENRGWLVGWLLVVVIEIYGLCGVGCGSLVTWLR